MPDLTLPRPLAGSNIRLRIPQPGDLAFIRRLWSDPETMAPLGGPFRMTEQQMLAWYARMVDPGRGSDLFTLIETHAGEPVGEASFHRLSWASMEADFNIKVLATCRRRGYGAEATGLLLGYFFNNLGGQRMIDDLALENPAGQAALAKFGFVHDPSEKGVYRMVITRAMYFSRHR